MVLLFSLKCLWILRFKLEIHVMEITPSGNSNHLAWLSSRESKYDVICRKNRRLYF